MVWLRYSPTFWQLLLYPASFINVLDPQVGQNLYRSCQTKMEIAWASIPAWLSSNAIKEIKLLLSNSASGFNFSTSSESTIVTSTANQMLPLSRSSSLLGPVSSLKSHPRRMIGNSFFSDLFLSWLTWSWEYLHSEYFLLSEDGGIAYTFCLDSRMYWLDGSFNLDSSQDSSSLCNACLSKGLCPKKLITSDGADDFGVETICSWMDLAHVTLLQNSAIWSAVWPALFTKWRFAL